ncbi:hypothetical protein P692DRAFT_20842453, partial [Suillus brevipes Sb2]
HEHDHVVRATKRRKLSTKAGRMAISGLVGGDHGIESDSASEKLLGGFRELCGKRKWRPRL